MANFSVFFGIKLAANRFFFDMGNTHAIAGTNDNLGVYQENISAAESRIRDVDIAAETVNFTKLQILSQSGTAMLAQANSAPNNVLSLLKG